jgi:hypothetical protein
VQLKSTDDVLPSSGILKRTACWIKNWTLKWIQKRNRNTKSTGKVPVLILLIISSYLLVNLWEFFVLFVVLYVSGPAHIPRLNVASWWNWGRCTSKIETVVIIFNVLHLCYTVLSITCIRLGSDSRQTLQSCFVTTSTCLLVSSCPSSPVLCG